MVSLPDRMWRTLRGRLERAPVWPPGAVMALGDVGHLDRHGWTKVTTLDALGISFTADPPGARGDLDLMSDQGVTMDYRANAEAGVAAGRIMFGFAAAGAFVFKAHAVSAARIADLRAVEAQVSAYPGWQRGWTILTEVCTGGPACILVSEQTNASVTLHLDGGTVLPVGIATQMTLGTRNGMAATWVTSEPAPVLIRGHYLRRGPVARPGLRNRGDDGPQSTDQHPPMLVELESPEDNQL